jgi:hypothetical protein
MAETKLLVNAFGARIKKELSDPKTMKVLILAIQKYFDKNNEIIYANSPSKRLFFVPADKEVMYHALKIDPSEVKVVLKQIPSIQASWVMLNDPFIILSCLAIRELSIQKKEVERNFVMMYLNMKFFSNRQYQSFKFEPNEQIMAYTINDLSDKFKYKMLKNNYNVIKDTALTSHATYEKILIEGYDSALFTYLPQMENRIAKLIKNIAELYYDNRDNKRYLNLDRSFDDENEHAIEKSTSSSTILMMADGVAHDFVTKKVNIGLIKLACTKNEVSTSNLFNTLNSIKAHEDPAVITKLIADILTQLFNADNSIIERVCSKDFVVQALKQLSVSNTVSTELIEIKALLEKLLLEHNSKYAATNRAATKTNYRSALYAYFVYLIIMFRCH